MVRIKKKRNKHFKAQEKHNSICEDVKSLLEDKNNYDKVDINYEYDLGECDVLCRNKSREVYYEVKGSYSSKSYKKAQRQLNRWTGYKYGEGCKDYYGVYYTPERVYILSKNGKSRRLRIK